MRTSARNACPIGSQCLAGQPFELVQVLGEEDRTQIADVEPSARSPHDHILFRQPAHAASLVRGQRNPQQIETARKVEKGKQLVARKIRFGNAMLERVLRERGPEVGFFGGIILQFLLEAGTTVLQPPRVAQSRPRPRYGAEGPRLRRSSCAARH